MKKLIYTIAIIVSMTIMANTSLIAQVTCHLVGKECEGTCGTWYFANQQNPQNPQSAGQPYCSTLKIEKDKDGKKEDKDKKDKDKDKYECHCVLIHTSSLCTSTDGADCVGDCPNVYPTREDAINGTNPIVGECITQRTIAVYCGCKYTK